MWALLSTLTPFLPRVTIFGFDACRFVAAGEGIHTAMMGGKAAAETIADMYKTGDWSKQSCKQYARRWYNAYGHDFFMSQAMANVIYRCVRGAGQRRMGVGVWRANLCSG